MELGITTRIIPMLRNILSNGIKTHKNPEWESPTISGPFKPLNVWEHNSWGCRISWFDENFEQIEGCYRALNVSSIPPDVSYTLGSGVTPIDDNEGEIPLEIREGVIIADRLNISYGEEREKYSLVFFLVKKSEYMSDPRDMFFADVEYIHHRVL